MTVRSFIRISIGVSLLALSGCASFKELRPNPEIVPDEGQYQDLKNKDQNFQLKKDDRYLIRFPKPVREDFYLVLVGKSKPQIHSYLRSFFDVEADSTLTHSFGVKEGTNQVIQDEATKSDSVTLYSIDSASALYTWLIDTVREDVDLSLRYRYVRQWRYSYENRLEKIEALWNVSRQDRSLYSAITPDYNTDSLDYARLIDLYTPTVANLQSVQKDLRKLAQIFPPDVKIPGDSTYTAYLKFSTRVDNELSFQKNFLDALTVLKIEKETRGDIAALLRSAPDFIKYFVASKNAPSRLVEKVRKTLSARLDEVLPFYEAVLKKSEEGTDQSFAELANSEKLYIACNEPVPADLKALIPFIKKYSEEWEAMRAVDANLADLDALSTGLNERPSDAFYQQALSLLQEAHANLPESEVRGMEKYGKYKCSIVLDQKITNTGKCIAALTEQFKSLRVFDSQIREVNAAFGTAPAWPEDSFYGDLMNHVDEMRKALLKSTAESADPYGNRKAAVWAAGRMSGAVKQENDFRQRYQKANELVRQINALKAQANYRGIIRTLNANRSLGFLLSQYPDIDTLSLGIQTRAITAALSVNAWKNAESKIDELFRDREFLNPDAIAEKRNQSVRHFEAELYQKVDAVSRSAAESFIKAHELTVKNVPGLYKDSVFLPVYRLQFSSEGQRELQQKQKHIEGYLTQLKNVDFPETAIKALYRELTKNILDQGVEKARAIADHGKAYKGTNKQVRNLIDECDYTVAKVFSKPSEYRKFFVLPTTSNKKGTNDYVLRLALKIPSDAAFPIFDINVTVPREIAQNTNQAWFQEISINKKPIKNEGRFHITAPTSSNNYESQITPVQIDKAGSNIFEIKLKYPGFRVFEVSVMAQKPIIRKN
jgi:hypothetical protein